MIVFETPTELDLLALRTMGLSAKEGENPFGHFGTGLKHAMSILMRNGCAVRIQAGMIRLEIGIERRTFRGEEFDFVVGKPESEPQFDLGFTTLLARDWEMWMAFRELYSNTIDEAGRTFQSMAMPAPGEGVTTICVIGQAFEKIYEQRGEIIITDKPLWENENVAIHEGESDFIFYQGIRARKLERPSAYRYNVKQHCDLTEDRTIKYHWEADNRIRAAIAQCDNVEIVKKIITRPNETYERVMDWTKESPGAHFESAVEQCDSKSICPSAKISIAKPVNQKTPASPPPVARNLSEEQTAMLGEAFEMLSKIGADVSQYPIIPVGELEGGKLWMAKRGNIYLAQKSFISERHILAILIEGYATLQGYDARAWLQGCLNKALDIIREKNNA